MPVTDYVLPVPYFKINTDFHILNFSKQAEALFTITENITSIVDEESVAKLKNFLQTSDGAQPMEISMKTKNYPLELFDLYISWDHYLNGHLICIKKTSKTKILKTWFIDCRAGCPARILNCLKKGRASTGVRGD